ncbi:hypothetical protein [Kordia sp.]|uniref:hypothetical protein n=1 Tax=Kordia sp. TaxID=1965332 RepID=UPI003D6AC990
MKTQKLKGLALNKKVVSNFTGLQITGGGNTADNTNCASYCYACGQVPTKRTRCCNE